MKKLLCVCLGAAALTTLILAWPLGGPMSESGRYGPQRFFYADGTRDLGPGGGVIVGDPAAGVEGWRLRLGSEGAPRTAAAWKLPDLDPGERVARWDARFDLTVFSEHVRPTGGLVVTFGPIPDGPGSRGDGFAKIQGVSVRFDWAHRGHDPISIDVVVAGKILASRLVTFDFRGGEQGVALRWDRGRITIDFAGERLLDCVKTEGYRPAPGDRLAFAAYSGSLGVDIFIDGVAVQTQAREIPVGARVTISELHPAPVAGPRDEDLDRSGWLELENGTGGLVDLTGWSFRVTAAGESNPRAWQLPQFKIQPLAQAVLFFSGKDHRREAALHSPFPLPLAGGHVALVDPAGQMIDEVTFPAGAPHASFGRVGSPPSLGYLATPTPGEPNAGAQASHPRLPAVQMSPAGGITVGDADVTMVCEGLPPGGVIRYELGGPMPTDRSPVYSSALTVSTPTTVRARAFAAGHLPGPVAQRAFVHREDDVAQFSSNLPILVLDSFGQAIDAEFSPYEKRRYRQTHATLFVPDSTGRARVSGRPGFSGFGAMRVRGHSSALLLPKKQYAWEIRDDDGEDRPVSLLGMPAESDWVLAAPYSDKSLIRNVLAYDIGREVLGEGGGPRSRFVEVFFNQEGGPVSMSDYRGVYVLTEKIKRSAERIDVDRLNEWMTAPEKISGGYIIKFDKGLDWDERIETGVHRKNVGFVAPKSPSPLQKSWLRDYLTRFEKTLGGTNLYDEERGAAAFVDVDGFLRMNWMVEVFYEVDGWFRSTYFVKPRGDRLRAMPVWDYNLAMGNSQWMGAYTGLGWYVDAHPRRGHPWFKSLFRDPRLVARSWRIYHDLRRSVLSDAAIRQRIRDLASKLHEAAPRNFARWPNLGRSTWPGTRGFHERRTHGSEVEFVRDWLLRRLRWIDEQFVPQPELQVDGDRLTVTMPENFRGGVYYTTDGSDPGAHRAPPLEWFFEGRKHPARVLATGGEALAPEHWTGLGALPEAPAWEAATSGAVGYEIGTDNFAPFFEHDVSGMFDRSTSCLIRQEFVVDDESVLHDAVRVVLRMRFDDGFFAYLNGHPIADCNAPAERHWGAEATVTVEDVHAVRWVDFDITHLRHLFRKGRNLLAIHGLNDRATSSDALWSAGISIVRRAAIDPPESAMRYEGPLDLRGVRTVRVAAFTGRRWSATEVSAAR